MSAVKRPLLAFVTVAGLILAIFGFSASALAYPPGTAPTISLSASTAPAGSPVTVTGSNFTPNEAITIEEHSAVSTIGSATADGSGSFSAAVTLTSGVTGDHTIVAIGAAGDTASAAITITGSGSGNGNGNNGNGNGGLSNTGVAVVGIGAVGVALLAGGGLMLMAGRRRKATV